LFSNNKLEISQVSISQKQALANAIKYVCKPTLKCRADTQRRFASAKIRKINEKCKYSVKIFADAGKKVRDLTEMGGNAALEPLSDDIRRKGQRPYRH